MFSWLNTAKSFHFYCDEISCVNFKFSYVNYFEILKKLDIYCPNFIRGEAPNDRSSLAKNYMYMLKLYTTTVKIPLLLKYINTNFKLSKFHKNWNYAWVRLVNLNMSLTLNFSLALCCMRFYMFGIKRLVTHRARYLFRHLRIIKKDRSELTLQDELHVQYTSLNSIQAVNRLIASWLHVVKSFQYNA